LCSFLRHTDGKEERSPKGRLKAGRTERNLKAKGRTEGRKGRTEERKPSGRNGSTTAESRTNQDERPTAGRIPTGRKPEQKGGKCTFLLLPSFLPLFPFSVLFPFLFARKKNYFSAFTLLYATFLKKSENKFVK
jgi:hypothetical protein